MIGLKAAIGAGVVALLIGAYCMVLRSDIQALKAEAEKDGQIIDLQTKANEGFQETLDELKRSMAETAEIRRALDVAYANDLKGRDEEILNLQKMAGRKSHAANERPEVLERAIRARLNQRMRIVARETCPYCDDGDGGEADSGAAAPDPGS